MSRKRKINKRGLRRFLTIVAVVLASVTLCGFIVSISDGGENFFKPSEWSFREVNEDNLFQQLMFTDTDDDGVMIDGRDGVTVTLTDDNTLKIKGTAEADINQVIGSVALEAGQSYVFDSSLNEGTAGTIYMSVQIGSYTVNSFSGPVLIEGGKIADGQSATITLHIKDEYEVGRIELKPVLCKGTSTKDIVDFYG